MAHLWLIYLLKMVIFHGYVSLPEGIIDNIMGMYPFGSLTVCEVEYLYL
jgi:hypothetical protein